MLEHILKDDPVYRQLKDEVEDYCGPVLVSGCTDTAKWHLTSLIGNHRKKQFKIIIVPDENKARQWVEASHFFGEKIQYIPAKDPLFYTADVHGNAIARDRMLAIKKIVDDKCGTFVMTIDAVMDQVVPLSDIKNHKMTFKMGETLEEATIAEEFVARGYEKAPFVEAPGEFAVRGGIIDIFPYTQESPYRIELWGDEIDSIRSFDKESQRSIEEVETLTIYPASEIILNQPRIEHGLRNMEEDYEKLSQKFKKEKKYDQEARLRKEMDRVREELRELHMLIGVEGYGLTYLVACLRRGDKSQPVTLWCLRVRSHDFHLVATVQFLAELYIFPVDAGTRTPASQVGVDRKGKVEHGSPLRQFVQIAFGSKYEYLVLI